MNTFEYLSKNNEFASIYSSVKSAIEYKDNDPGAALAKITSVFEELVNKVFREQRLDPQYGSLHEKIESLYQHTIIDQACKVYLGHLRVIRNQFSAHQTLRRGEVVQPDSTIVAFALKNLYEFLSWYVIDYLKRDIKLSSFEEYIKSNTGLITREENRVIKVMDLPKFYVDKEYRNLKLYGKIKELDTKEELSVLKMFFTTKKTLTDIEKEVFDISYDGNLVYYIINQSDSRGLTNSWREFVLSIGVKKAIQEISSRLPAEGSSDYLKFEQEKKVLEVLKLVDMLK
jgi:hypothetical protein